MVTGVVEEIMAPENVVGWSCAVYPGQPHWIIPADIT